MKKWIPWILTGVFAAWVLSTLRPVPDRDGFRVRDFGSLPVLLNGRVQPFDSVARNSLLMMRGKQTVKAGEGRYLSATEWLMDVMIRPEVASDYKVFRVQHPDLQGLVGGQGSGLQYFSLKELTPKLEELEKQARRISESKKEVKLRTPYEKDVMHLADSIMLYHQLKNSFRPEGAEEFGDKDFVSELARYRAAIKPGVAALQASDQHQHFKQEDLQRIGGFFNRYREVARFGYALAVPPVNPAAARDEWSNVGTSLMESMKNGEIHPVLDYFATMSFAYRSQRPAEFNQALTDYRQWLAQKQLVPELTKGSREFFFRQLEPFYKSMVIYVAALLLGCAFWLNWTPWLRQSAFYLLALAFVIHTVGLGFRMFLEGRPPVTNLYSSAVFVGWGAALLGLILERIYRDGIGIVVAGAVGFSTQIIAHHLAMSGDTMEMLQAVLDTNFWLATHVVCITAGYSSMFIAGFLAILYILRGVFTKSLSESTAKTLTRMVYGIVCFSTLFSFVGTILGGIWADQSWGRFWGWDPKENGALLIVIWCAIILHARWGGMIRERGLMAMAVFGNIVTSFSWFGVNMLGVGLHSYGFMDKAFFWLMVFISSQAIIIALCLLPPRFWLSFRKLAESPLPTAGPGSPGVGTRGPASAGA